MSNILIFPSFFKCICFIAIYYVLPTTSSKQFRRDYVYNSKTDAFYKFHMESATLYETTCDSEGAELMVPTSDEDIEQAHGLFKQYPDIGEFAWIQRDGKKHDSEEETPLIILDDNVIVNKPANSRIPYSTAECDVLLRDGNIRSYYCTESLPFICKVEAKNVIEDKQCNVFVKGYRYFESVGSCYKISNKAFSWNEAYSECRAEGAHLAIINSELEHQVIYNISNEAGFVNRAMAPHFFFVGIRAEKKTDGSPIVFKTIFNQTLEEAGYSQWSANEPNNYQGNEYCGTILKNDGKYNDIFCSDLYGFICEKEIK